jgi:DNA-binding transcriptional regulator YiaG
MSLTFEQHTKTTMIVLDGKTPVAKARRWGIGWWLLTLEKASWVDPRARQPIRDDLPADFKDMFSKYPNMLAVKSTAEARKIMQSLLQTGVSTKPKTRWKNELSGAEVRAARETFSISASEAAAFFGLNDGAAWRRWERNGVSGSAAILIYLCLKSQAARSFIGLKIAGD